MRTEFCGSGSSSSNSSESPRTLTTMLRYSPAKASSADELNAILTPPSKGWNWSKIDTPSNAANLDGSFTETCRKPLGRFHSFDVKRSLFSCKRPADDEQTTWNVESPATKRLKEAETAIHNISLQSPDVKSPCAVSENIKEMVKRLSTESDLVADGSRPNSLPTIAGKHSDLKAISPDTLGAVLSGCYADEIDEVTVIDCRYPYEFNGGHIKGALNLYTRDAINQFLSRHRHAHRSDKKHVLVFHCEFSSERGPRMYRHIRSEDRSMNKDHYPRLNFPEIYLLEGGYKQFYNAHVTQCEPQRYVPMLHKDHTDDLRHFRQKSKSWTAGERSQLSRMSLRF